MPEPVGLRQHTAAATQTRADWLDCADTGATGCIKRTQIAAVLGLRRMQKAERNSAGRRTTCPWRIGLASIPSGSSTFAHGAVIVHGCCPVGVRSHAWRPAPCPRTAWVTGRGGYCLSCAAARSPDAWPVFPPCKLAGWGAWTSCQLINRFLTHCCLRPASRPGYTHGHGAQKKRATGFATRSGNPG